MEVVFGGSFNPPTKAHYEIAKYIINKYKNSEFVFLPANNFYNKGELINFSDRLQMLEIVCNKLGPRAKVSNFEGTLDKYLGTYYTLSHFKNPVFLMGADNFITLPSWINFKNLIKDFKFIIIPRDDINLKKVFQENDLLNKYKDNFTIINEFRKLDLSSSTYRKTLDSSLLLTEVNEYIKTNNLYKE